MKIRTFFYLADPLPKLSELCQHISYLLKAFKKSEIWFQTFSRFFNKNKEEEIFKIFPPHWKPAIWSRRVMIPDQLSIARSIHLYCSLIPIHTIYFLCICNIYSFDHSNCEFPLMQDWVSGVRLSASDGQGHQQYKVSGEGGGEGMSLILVRSSQTYSNANSWSVEGGICL